MPKFIVSCDIIVPAVLEIEATDEEAAINNVHNMSALLVLKSGDANTDAAEFLQDSVHVEDIVP